MKTHRLKTWPSFFEAIISGKKKFELRKNDRDFAVGDTIVLCEFDPAKDVTLEGWKFTGREVPATITFIVQGVFGLPENLCVMSIETHAP
jgi:hypothetical protein